MSAAPFNVPFVIHEAVADCGFRVRHDASTIGTSLVVSSSSSSNNVNNNNGSNNSAAAADLLVRLLLPLQDSTALLLLKTYSTPTPATSPSSSYIMLYGHSAPISAPIVTARVEMEDPVLGLAHNCFLTAAENGEVILWDGLDGRPLAISALGVFGSGGGGGDNTAASIPTIIRTTSSSRFVLVGGMTDKIAILQLPSLDTVKVVSVSKNWISAFSIFPADHPTQDHILLADFNGQISAITWDELTFDLIQPPSTQPVPIINQTATDEMAKAAAATTTSTAAAAQSQFDAFSRIIHMESSPWDSSLLCCLRNRFLTIYVLKKDGLFQFALVECPLEKAWWVGARFVSPCTIMAWTRDGRAFLYYLGGRNEVRFCRIDVTPGSDYALIGSTEYAAAFVKWSDYTRKSAAKGGEMTLVIEFNDASTSSTLQSSSSSSSDSIFTHYQSAFTNVLSSVNATPRLFSLRVHSGRLTVWDIQKGRTLQTEFEHVADDGRLKVCPSDECLVLHLTTCTKEEYQPKITASIVIQDRFLAVGLDSGIILFMPVAYPIFNPAVFNDTDVFDSGSIENQFRQPLPSPDFARRRLLGHVGKITCLSFMCLESGGGNGKHLLISGGADCTVRIWDLRTGALMSTFLAHSERVTALFPLSPFNQFDEGGPPLSPINSGMEFVLRMMKCRHCIVSVGLDRTVAVIDVEELFCKYRFTGHSAQVAALYWKINDEVLIVQCRDGNSHIWQLRTSHLDRIESGQTEDDIIQGYDFKLDIPFSGQISSRQASSSRSTLSVFSSEHPSVLVLFVNVRRFALEIRNGFSDGYFSKLLKAKSLAAAASSRSGSPSPFISGESTLTAQTKDLIPQLSLNTSDLTNSDQVFDDSTLSPGIDTSVTGLNHETVIGISSALMLWGVDSEIEKVCRDIFGIKPCLPYVSAGLRGIGGCFSVPFTVDLDSTLSYGDYPTGRQDWNISATSTASRLLQFTSVARALFSKEKMDSSLSTSLQNYGASLPRGLAHSSFTFLAKYWQDQSDDVQDCTHKLFAVTLRSMTKEEKLAYCAYWLQHVPSSNSKIKKHSKLAMRASIIMAMVIADEPQLLNSKDIKNVAEALDLAMKEESKSPYRIAAVELIGRAFSVWCPYINAGNVLRSILHSTGLGIQPSNVGAPTHTNNSTATAATGSIDHSSANITNVSAATSTSSINANTSSASIASAAPPPLHPALIVASKLAVAQIAASNSSLFVSTITFDLSHSKSATERSDCLKLLGLFISKKPLIIYPYLAQIVEAVVKSLDPNSPYLRDTLQPLVTVCLSELVRYFPMISFHSGTQRLAVGTNDGTTILYDLRTATKVQVLEGHSKVVSAVSMSKDGKLLVTFSIEENSVRFWQSPGGFFGAIVGALGTGAAKAGHGSAAIAGVAHMKMFRNFNVGPPEVNVSVPSILEEVRFDWLTERSVKMKSVRGLELQFSV